MMRRGFEYAIENNEETSIEWSSYSQNKRIVEQLKNEIEGLKDGVDIFPSLNQFTQKMIAIHIIDETGKILFVNDTLVEKLQTPKNLLQNETIGTLYKFYTIDGLNNFSRQVHQGKYFEGTVAISYKDNQPIWMETKMCPIFDEKASCIYYVVFQFEICKQRSKSFDINDLQLDPLFHPETDAVYQYFRIQSTEREGYYKCVGGSEKILYFLKSYFEIQLNHEFYLTNTTFQFVGLYNHISTMLTTGQPLLKRFLYHGKVFYLSITPMKRADGLEEFFGLIVNTTTKDYIDYSVYLDAYYDEITGLPNRKRLLSHYKEIIEGYSLEQRFACIHIDVKNFIRIIGMYGEALSSSILVELSQRLRKQLPKKSGLYHLGYDEFFVLLAYDLEKDLEQLLDNLQNCVFAPFSHKISLSINMGVVRFTREDFHTQDIFKNAKLALRYAKKSDRSSILYFTKKMHKAYLRELEIEQKLRAAIFKGELELFYQPKFSLYEKQLVGLEALVRWRDGNRMVNPAEFIPIAEESGLIVLLGDFVLRKACEQGAKWLSEGRNPISIAVNISALELEKRDLAVRVFQILEETQYPAHMLELEITENSLVSNIEWAKDMLIELRTAGVRISIDDFGKGHSSFSYLHDFPFDTLKIDQTFIRDVDRDSKKESIVRAMIYIGHSFKKQVIAEGVETIEVMNFLQKLNCDAVQGFFLSLPLPLVELERRYLKPQKNGIRRERWRQ